MAFLGFQIDSSQAVSADANLRKMTAASAQAEAATTRLGSVSNAASGGIRGIASAANAEATALAMVTAKTQMNTAALHANATASKMASYQRKNLIFQLNDVGVSLASGMNPLMVAVQQGSQIATIYDGGVVPALKETAKMAGMAALAFWPIGLAIAAVTVGVAGMTSEINKSSKVTVGFGDTLKAVFQTIWDTFTNFIKPATDAIGEAISAVWDAVSLATKIAMNYLLNSTVGAVKTIGAIWNGLPSAIGDVAIVMANTIIIAFEGAINKAGELLNAFIDASNSKLGTSIGKIGKFELPKFANPLAGSKDKLGQNVSQIANENVDYMGGFFNDVQDHAIKNAIDGNKDLAKAAKAAAKELERQAKAYDKIVLGANQFIESQHLAASSLGMSAEAIASAKYQQELLNKVANDNIDLTPKQTEQLSALASAMAAAEEAARVMTEAYNFGKDVFSGFFGDLKTGLSEGKGLWESLANAATSALDKIADKALSMAANGIFDMIFGAVMGGIGGGGGGSWNIPTGFQAGGFFPGFASGTNSAPGGLSWVGENGPELMNVPRGAQIMPHPQSMRMAANSNGSNDNGAPQFNIVNHIDARGATADAAPEIARQVTANIRSQIPQMIEAYNKNPYRRSAS